MEGIKFSKNPKLKKPYFIAAWPGMGEVAFKAATHLVHKLKAEEFAQVPPEDFFYLTESIVTEGILKVPELPFGRFYYWKNPATKIGGSARNSGGKPEGNDLIIFISNAQPDLAKAEDYCKRIISVARSLRVKAVISLAAMPQAIDHTQPSKVWFAATSREVADSLKKHNLRLLAEGQISGMNGLFLGIAKREGFDGFCLLGEIPLYTIQIENPRACGATLEALAKILNIKIDFSELNEEAHIMEGEINKLLDYLKLGAPIGPISEEDIEKIKKSLTQLTKLPVSIKENIEKLFSQARADISRANELKTELDKWNVYKEYEDRFLDLFKKKKEGNN
ncbi:MAG: PAC2 family protein [Candidatus Omnitrophica bacterium]|nr:PAC2 family protein [Candidatus Omnitrophota bacterium]MDD5592547.1 PAC2 family protein [Candidatus Omnitrophota bacterium]